MSGLAFSSSLSSSDSASCDMLRGLGGGAINGARGGSAFKVSLFVLLEIMY